MVSKGWNRRVWRLAGPIMLANVSVPLLGVVDTAVVGHLPGAHFVGAVAVASLIFNILYFGFGFLRMGTTGLTAQALGAGEPDEVRATLTRALFVATVMGAAMMALQQPIAWAAFALIDASDKVERLAVAYFSIRIWAAPAALANIALLGWFVGIQKARAVLVLQLVVNGVNIALDLWFVLVLGLGVEGVAMATVISQLGGLALGLGLVRRNLRPIGGRWRLDLALDRIRLRRMVAVNRDIFLRSVFIDAAFFLFTALSARMGDVVLAANAVLLHFWTFLAYAVDGFAHAAEALVGSAVGARHRQHLRGAVRATSLWALVFSGAFTLFYAVFGTLLIDVITSVPEVRDAARAYLPWIVVSPLIAIWGFQLDGIFIGATWTAEMRDAMLISLAVYVAALVVFLPPLGNHGLWLAFTVFTAARGVTLAVRYPRLERTVDKAA